MEEHLRVLLFLYCAQRDFLFWVAHISWYSIGMIKIDKEKIAEIMEKHGAIVGYIFGSAARGTVEPHSDIDVAVLFDEKKVPKENQFDEKVSISEETASACNVHNADVINLNQIIDPVIRFEAVLKGKAILIKDFSANARLVRGILREYEDTRHMRETSYRILREQAKSGAFGRVLVRPSKYVTTQ